jgi:putative transcription factor
MSWELKPNTPGKKPKPKIYKHRRRTHKTSVKQQSPFNTQLELIDNFGILIRQARETAGLSHEDLGRKINEKVSQLKKLESNKMIPNHRLAKKLEYTLKIKLLVPLSEEKVSKNHLKSSPSKAITLGDLIEKGKQQPGGKKSQA